MAQSIEDIPMRSPNVTLHIKIATNIYNTDYLPILSYNCFAFCVNICLSLQTLTLVRYLRSWGVTPLLSVAAYTMVLQLILYYSLFIYVSVLAELDETSTRQRNTASLIPTTAPTHGLLKT
jgi:hypothetical protein